jgi:hypothetical protein
MKKMPITESIVVLTIVTLSILLTSCESSHFKFDEGMKYGTTLTLNNNTFGVNDFKVGDTGTYVVSFGSIDYGRNLGSPWYFNEYEPSISNGTFNSSLLDKLYQDSIGTITFNYDGTGVLNITNQDSVKVESKFVWQKTKRDRNYVYLTIDFEPTPITTYVTKEPMYVFNYVKVKDGLWKYQNTMDTYSGKWKWGGNKLMNDEGGK